MKSVRLLYRIAGLCCAVLVAGCGSDDVELSPGEAALSVAKQKWSGANMQSYRFELERECFCPPPQAFIVTVTANEISAVTYKVSGEPVSAENIRFLPTINGLFSIIDKAYADKADGVDVKYDGALGYPITTALDYDTQTADDEITYKVSKVTRL
jgi:hypothetical protein